MMTACARVSISPYSFRSVPTSVRCSSVRSSVPPSSARRVRISEARSASFWLGFTGRFLVRLHQAQPATSRGYQPLRRPQPIRNEFVPGAPLRPAGVALASGLRDVASPTQGLKVRAIEGSAALFQRDDVVDLQSARPCGISDSASRPGPAPRSGPGAIASHRGDDDGRSSADRAEVDPAALGLPAPWTPAPRRGLPPPRHRRGLAGTARRRCSSRVSSCRPGPLPPAPRRQPRAE